MPFRHPDSVHHVFGTRTSEPKHNSRPRRVCWGTEMMAKFTLLTSSIELVILVDFMPGLSAPPKQRSISVHCHVSIIRKLRTASDARFAIPMGLELALRPSAQTACLRQPSSFCHSMTRNT
ncbi:hypothetical protein SCLCIDRAFT_1108389 [Scleroderma citrinum Foug A]|uniref:Uncharacterized protein n=1 Tax=Scleroderma citrinum Foug A TaxID=1036808 RepID=A0A0C3ARJ1_9AGAM|nr:hypothetical protein SCLCIDRAFT_1108389 [Scleroderma citrinum Foug A]